METCHMCDVTTYDDKIRQCENCNYNICEGCSFHCSSDNILHIHDYSNVFCSDCTITCSICNITVCNETNSNLTICAKCSYDKLEDTIKERDVLLQLYLKKIIPLIPVLIDIIIQYYR